MPFLSLCVSAVGWPSTKTLSIDTASPTSPDLLQKRRYTMDVAPPDNPVLAAANDIMMKRIQPIGAGRDLPSRFRGADTDDPSFDFSRIIAAA